MNNDPHQLHLILDTNGFNIEESKGNMRRMLYTEPVSTLAVAYTKLAYLSQAPKAELCKWLIRNGYEPWFDVNGPSSQLNYPITLESWTLSYDD